MTIHYVLYTLFSLAIFWYLGKQFIEQIKEEKEAIENERQMLKQYPYLVKTDGESDAK